MIEPVALPKSCVTCPHWQIDRRAPESTPACHRGQCRKGPPGPTGWPPANSDDWCGEHPERNCVVMIDNEFDCIVPAWAKDRIEESQQVYEAAVAKTNGHRIGA